MQLKGLGTKERGYIILEAVTRVFGVLTGTLSDYHVLL